MPRKVHEVHSVYKRGLNPLLETVQLNPSTVNNLNMSISVQGKTAIVTGAGSGMSPAYCSIKRKLTS